MSTGPSPLVRVAVGPAPFVRVAAACIVAAAAISAISAGAAQAGGVAASFTPGQRLAGSLASPSEVATFAFDAVAGTKFRATVKGDSTLSPEVSVLQDPGGILISHGFPDAANTAVIADVPIPSTGAYRLVVASFAGTSGAFEATTKQKLPKDAKGLQPTGSTAFDPIHFDAVAGTRFRARFEGANGYAIPVLIGPAGPVALSDHLWFQSPNQTGVFEFKLGQTGSYAIAFSSGKQHYDARIRLTPPKGKSSSEPRWKTHGRFVPKYLEKSPLFIEVNALAVFDPGDGRGPLLCAGGRAGQKGFVMLFDGESWQEPTGFDGAVHSLAVYDDGSGPALYVGGAFRHSNLVFDALNGVMKWDGSVFGGEPVENGVNGDADSRVTSLSVFDDGSGPALFAAGDFLTAGGVVDGVVSPGVARWNGSNWSSVGGGKQGLLGRTAVHDDGFGAALYFTGSATYFGVPQDDGVWRWGGGAWSEVVASSTSPWGGSGRVQALASFAPIGAPEPALFAAGEFDSLDSSPALCLARQIPGGWLQPWVGDGLAQPEVELALTALEAIDLGVGAGPALHTAGEFRAGGKFQDAVARLDGETWSILGKLGELQDDPRAHAMVVYDDRSGRGPALYVGGRFDAVNGKKTFCLARWYPGGPVFAAGK